MVCPAITAGPDNPDTFNSVRPVPLSPVTPSTAYKLRLAKYVNEFNHSTLTPLVIVIASTPGVINVQF